MNWSVRHVDEHDASLTAEWWEGHGQAPPNVAILPKCGVVALHEGKESAAGWLYMDNSTGVCWAAWLVTNPWIGIRQRHEGMRHVLQALKVMAEANDYGVMFTETSSHGLGVLLQREGFQKNHQVTQFFGSTREVA